MSYEPLSNFFSFIHNENFFYWLFISAIILLATGILFFVGVRLYYYYKIEKSDGNYNCDEMSKRLALQPYRMVQIIFEILISNTCVLVSFWLYDVLNTASIFANDYSSYILLLLISCAVLVNNLIDTKLNQDMLSTNDKKAIRLLSSLSIIFILLVVRLIYGDSNYNEFLFSYTALVLGRFIFYDSFFETIAKDIKGCCKKIYIIPLLIALFLISVVFYTGKRLIITTTNAFEGILIVHIVMILCVYIAKRLDNCV